MLAQNSDDFLGFAHLLRKYWDLQKDVEAEKVLPAFFGHAYLAHKIFTIYSRRLGA